MKSTSFDENRDVPSTQGNDRPQPKNSVAPSPNVTTPAGYILSDPVALNNLPDSVREQVLPLLTPVVASTLHAVQNSTSATASSPETSKKTTCYFLDRLPPEIRLQIYRLLLLNPMLADTSSIFEDADIGAGTEYDLHLQILTTCRQIHKEASEVLYGEGRFIMVCIEPIALRPTEGPIQRSPITRYSAPKQQLPSSTQLSPAILSQVAKWKVITTTRAMSERESMSALDFCQSISRQPPRSLELCIADFNEIEITRWGSPRLTDILKHFESRRNVGHFNVRDTERSETPLELLFIGGTLVSDLAGKGDAIARLITLVEGDSPVEFLFDMEERLFEYARSFEGYEIFRENMCGRNSARNFYLGIYHPLSKMCQELDFENILKRHPLEVAMKAATEATTYHDAIAL